MEQDEGSRSSRLLQSILDELQQLTGKMERDETRQDEINETTACFENAPRNKAGEFETKRWQGQET